MEMSPRWGIWPALWLALASAVPAEDAGQSPFDNEPAYVSLYCAPRASPTISGTRSDPAWKSIPLETRFYKFWDRPGNLATVPIVSPIRTEMQVCYDDLGLTFALRCPTNMSKLKADHNQRDDGSVWRDDCVELYMDPNNSGMGFLKFITNPNGIRCDIDVMDTQNWNYAWSPDNWKALTSKDDTAWTVELFFPWTDLGYRPKDGDLWTMNVSQFAFDSMGNATNWSVGADYETPSAYGYIYFGTDARQALERHTETISRTKGKRWMVYQPDHVLVHDSGKFTTYAYRDWAGTAMAAVRKRREDMAAALGACGDTVPKEMQPELASAMETLAKIEERLRGEASSETCIEARPALAVVYSVLDDVYYWAKLQTLLKEVAARPPP